MYKRFFDKIALSYLVIIVVVFVVIISYATHISSERLVTEKTNNLSNQAQFIASDYVIPYCEGELSGHELQSVFNHLETSMGTQIWYSDINGDILFISYPKNYEERPVNLYEYDDSGILEKEFTFTGHFYDVFSEQMLTYGTPVYDKYNNNLGTITLHVPYRQISDLMRNMFLNFLVPVCVIIILCMFFLLYLAKKILVPLNQLNLAARAYAAGNFYEKTGIKSDDEIGELAANLEYMASELEKQEEYRKSFIANISHDFRSPLTSIKGYINAMLDGTIPKDNQERYLNIVLSETERLSKLTTSMLELNRSDASGLILNFTDFDIMEIINSTIDIFEGTCKQRYIVIRKNCQASETIVHADKTKIQQVIYNLVDNAIKFSPHASTITVSVKEVNDKIFISVKDTGRGIEREKQSKVWDRFYKADVSRGKDKQGSGLGLSIIREIIRAHDEHITLTSTPGVGSDFTFSLKKSKA